MPRIVFVEANGVEHVVGAEVGRSLMQVATENLVPGIVGDCGGYCNCATCHSYIDDAWIERVGAASGDEADLLECAMDVRANSRLTCQIKVTEDMDGIVIRLPKAQI